MSLTQKNLLLVVCVSAVVLPGVAWVYFRSARIDAMPEVACVNNLRMIDGAKQQWAIEHKDATNLDVSWDNIVPYLGRKGATARTPKCPGGGMYSIGKRGQVPACSIAEHMQRMRASAFIPRHFGGALPLALTADGECWANVAACVAK